MSAAATTAFYYTSVARAIEVAVPPIGTELLPVLDDYPTTRAVQFPQGDSGDLVGSTLAHLGMTAD